MLKLISRVVFQSKPAGTIRLLMSLVLEGSTISSDVQEATNAANPSTAERNFIFIFDRCPSLSGQNLSCSFKMIDILLLAIVLINYNIEILLKILIVNKIL